MEQELNHRDIGRDLKLFMFHEYSPGSCFFLPHGAKVYNNLMQFLRYCYDKLGYQEVITPNIYYKKLFKTSGHWEKYQENMFVIKHHPHHNQENLENEQNNEIINEYDEQNDNIFILKCMNCPGHCLMIKQMMQSYNDLPIRLADFGALHRNELSGALTGLTRVRRFQQDDAHIFCTMEQVETEIQNFLNFMQKVYNHFGLEISVGLSTRPEKYIGELDNWNKAEEILKQQIQKFPGWYINEGDGAFYGPKIDIKIKDSLKREHQCGTIQLDFNLPERFDLKYAMPDQTFRRPVMIHRAIYGSFERFIAILLEHTGGLLPFWLSPRQICIIPVSGKFISYAEEVKQYFSGFSVEVDSSDEKINKKIRNAEVMKFNYIFVVGEKEIEARTVNIRTKDGIIGVKSLEETMQIFTDESNKRFIFG
jgi:threonyl-tRNA synthetase